MSIFDTLRAAWRRGTPGFNRLESMILNALQAQLDSATAERLRTRIAQVNLVQRHDGGREVNCYEMRGGAPVLDEATRLVDSKGEKAFAAFAFTSKGAPFTGRIWLVDGLFFSLEFDNPTEHCIEEDVESLSVRLLKD